MDIYFTRMLYAEQIVKLVEEKHLIWDYMTKIAF